jgi:hypothetical protein
MLSLISYSYVLPVQVDMPSLGRISSGVTHSNACEVKTEKKKTFWEELMKGKRERKWVVVRDTTFGAGGKKLYLRF